MLGIDVSKDSLSCTLLDQKTKATLWSVTVPNTKDGIQRLLRKTPDDRPWVLEPTGCYSIQVAKGAKEPGRTVLLAPPRKAKMYLASLQSRAKTDALDSRGLGLYALSETLSPYPIKSQSVDHLDQMLSARKGLSRAHSRLQLQAAALPLVQEPLKEALAALQKQIKALDAQIQEKTKDQTTFPAVKELRRVPGIGPVTAAALSSRLSAKHFTHPDQFVAYIGLDVAVRQSGQKKGKGALTRQGDAELRRLLFLCAQSSLRVKGSPFKERYERERQKGLPSTAATCAVARKLARLAWSLVKHNAAYNPDWVQTQRPNPKRNSDHNPIPAKALD